MNYLHQVPRIRDGLDDLIKNDPVFRAMTIDVEQFRWGYIGPGFPGLVRIVIGQQISTSAADALWTRFENAMPRITPNAVMVLKDDDMRKLGLSYQKANYIRGLATAVKDKTFNPEKLEDLSDEQVYEAITALKGFGDWSAEMFLMFGLARPDIWPAGDLGIQEGLRVYSGATDRPNAEQTKEAGQIFAGRRTAAALLLWHLKARARLKA
ncbi:MAG: DNA-3-methyladenine glycosylase 2 family protein [Alphaproteobacteria bacterium]|nr:DNA-3-methyladenine glycosylase 2 family protein [Alphaproteobacteria bacterium]MBU0859994.1 DNA-3-methyladenine glycosylase 2 family protein [Alphaproteobacteria bacterium]